MAIQLNSEQVTECSNKEPATSPPLVTVLMPCLNEARTVGQCIDQAHAGCRAALARRADATNVDDASEPLGYEILIADNGSEDGSPEIARKHGARVVHIEQRGYGAALRGGIAAARGKYVVMGDADCSYDFGEVPRFLEKLEEGYDLVVGNRFAGGIQPGAMPWHHRYIGNPALSKMGQQLFGGPCKDWHCGLRAFRRQTILRLRFQANGMEFASEIIALSILRHLRISEIAVRLKPDGRERRPHLRSLRDGLRHVKLLISQYLKTSCSSPGTRLR